ncbi:ferritin [Microbacterium gorillae]|uniref:ferritin n=1 Tax=Microbacterium gorillae TaxID=1231063 RepID=UPI00058DAA5D|nr:ferritin [Microbacterium gorillae]
MKMSPELEKLFNDQITLEFGASMVYRQLAIEMEDNDFPGAAQWLRHQADEEIVHANKFIDHLADRGNHPSIGTISAPKSPGTTMLKVFNAALAHEQKVSAAIRGLVNAAEAEGDLDSRPLLNWFLSEQIEEESTVSEIIGRIQLIGDDGVGLYQLDLELAQRPVATTENTGGSPH